MSQARVIKTRKEHETALERIAALMDIDPIEGSAEADELELLALLVETYENEHFPINEPDPIDAVQFRMAQMGLRNKDLAPYIGSPSRVSEVLNRRRDLSISMIRKLNEGLGIPAAVLIRAPARRAAGGR